MYWLIIEMPVLLRIKHEELYRKLIAAGADIEIL